MNGCARHGIWLDDALERLELMEFAEYGRPHIKTLIFNTIANTHLLILSK
jgi:hypothetical protein